jgi:hypothetical protein
MRDVKGQPLDRDRALADTSGHGPNQMETHRMSRYKDLALRLAVVVSFVLVLAAPLRW